MKRPARKTSTTNHTRSEGLGLRTEKAELEELISKIKDLVSDSPEKAARVIDGWQNTGQTRASTPASAPIPATRRQVRRKAG